MSDDQRCRNCRHFVADGASPSGRGSCARWATGYYAKPEDLPPNMVIVEDDEGWGMSVGPDFGCVLWEPTR